MKYKGLQFQNKADKTVEIDVEGYIGWDPWDAPENQVNTKEKMKAELKKLANLKADTIIVNINSYGGDVNHGISIHDLLAENSAHIITKVNGMTASAATIIAVAGDERKMSDNALFLVHNASSIAWGDKNDAKTLADDLQKIDSRLANIYAKVTGNTNDEMLTLMNEDKGRGKWLTADEAKTFGFITDVFEPIRVAAYFSNDILRKYQLPEIPDNNKASSLIIRDFINDITKIFKSKNEHTMNKTEFKRLAKAAKVEGFETTDEGLLLNTEQAQAIEALLEQNEATIQAYSGLNEGETVDGLHTQITDLAKEKTDADAKIKSLEAEIETLSKTPPAKPTGANAGNDGDGDDPPVDEEAMRFYNLSKVK